ncbi:MAG TPA: ATP-binding protein [Chloroflexota bacterium]|jgi:signal transduction histidine kinase|nr:ATP-binding protein [Chloroflexota bacterium]
MTGLRLRLLATLAAAVLVALATVALVARWATGRELDRYVERSRYGLKSAAAQLVGSRGNRVVLIDPEGNVLVDTAGELTGRRLDDPLIQQLQFTREIAYVERTQRSRTFPDDGTSFIRMLPAPDSGGMPGEELFLASVNTSLAVAVIVGGLAAAVLALVFSRRVLGRVDALTAAARRMERGDLTQRVPVGSHDEIGELARAFNAMAESLSRNERLRRTMVTDVAHELRTPLTNVRGYLEALRDGVAEPTPSLIASLHEEAMLLGRLVEDLQELTLAEAGQLHLDRAAWTLDDLLGPAVELARPRALEKGVALRAELPPDLPPVEVDRTRIGQVLRNLLGNALTHTDAGGEIVLSAARLPGEVEVRVHDTGVGIPAEHLPHVFERFYRADRARARATGGAGIGLAIVKELVQAHGGRVGIESAAGRGTTVTFTLPIAETPSVPARALAPAAPS